MRLIEPFVKLEKVLKTNGITIEVINPGTIAFEKDSNRHWIACRKRFVVAMPGGYCELDTIKDVVDHLFPPVYDFDFQATFSFPVLFVEDGKVNLGYSNIETVPDEVWRLKGVRELYLNSTFLTQLSPKIGLLRQLEVIDLYSTDITALPPQIGELSRLVSLNVSCTRIATLPKYPGCHRFSMSYQI